MRSLGAFFVKILFLVTLFSCTSNKLKSDCIKCNISMAVRFINEDIVNEQMADSLFCTGTDSCLRNVEFMEVFNEALFVGLNKNPEMFIKLFSNSSKKEFILKQLERPINDTIELKKIIDKLTNITKGDSESRNKILQALNLALKNLIGN